MASGEPRKVISMIASSFLKDAERCFKENESYEILQSLYSIFGTTCTKAFDLLDNGRFVVFATNDDSRSIMKVEKNTDQNFVFFDINFCRCNTFKIDVLDSQTSLFCEHVLASKLSRIVRNFMTEQVSKADLKNLLYEHNIL